LMMTLPNFEVFQPCSPIEMKKILSHVIKTKKPSYVRICRNEVDEIYTSKFKFTPGKPVEILKGKNSVIISSGPLIHNCIEAIKIVNKKKIYPSLININSYKPFNHKLLFNLIKTKNNLLIVEDHVSHGGLSSLVYETLAKYGKSKCNVNSLNLDEKFSESGTPADLEKANGFDPQNIAKIINEKKYLAK